MPRKIFVDTFFEKERKTERNLRKVVTTCSEGASDPGPYP